MKQKTALCFFLFLVLWFVESVSAQKLKTNDIPVVDNEVSFTVRLTAPFDRQEIYRRAHYFIENDLMPYSGSFLLDTISKTRCNITDYLEVGASAVFYVFAWYMSYDLTMEYTDSLCVIRFDHIRFVEKEHYEDKAKWEADPFNRKLNMPEYSGKDIFIDKSYRVLLIRNASAKTTQAALKRFNAIIAGIKNNLNRIVFEE